MPKTGSKIILLETGESVKWQKEGNGVKIFLPSFIINSKGNIPALAFSFVQEEN